MTISHVAFDIGKILVGWQPQSASPEMSQTEARGIGMDAIRFTDAQALKQALSLRGLS